MFIFLIRPDSNVSNLSRFCSQAAAMRLKSERAAALDIQRLPGLPSSFVALDIMLGEDDNITFEVRA